jgi:hypothetical protein
MRFAIGLAWPANGEAVIRSLAATVGSQPVASVALLGGDAGLRFEQRGDGLHVHLPAQPPAKYAYALRVKFQRANRKPLNRARKGRQHGAVQGGGVKPLLCAAQRDS